MRSSCASVVAQRRELDAAFGVFDGLYEPGHLDRLRADERPRAARLQATHWVAFRETLDRPAHADPALVELFRRPRPA